DNTSGSFNTAIGMGALWHNNGNMHSTAVGALAMRYADNRTDGRETYNTAIGHESMRGSINNQQNNTGRWNTAVGSQTLTSMSSGDANTCIGAYGLHFNTTGNNNTAVGQGALQENKGNNQSTAVGYEAMHYADNRTTG